MTIKNGLKAISSVDNPIFKETKTLLTTKGIKKVGKHLVFGTKVFSEVLNHFDHLVQAAFIHPKTRDLGELRSHIKDHDFPVFELAPALFDELDVFNTKAPFLVLSNPALPIWEPDREPFGLELLCAAGDPRNLGAILRSAAAFRADKVVLLKESCSPFHPLCSRASAAMHLHLPLEIGPSIQELGSAKGTFWAFDLKGVDLKNVLWKRCVRLVLGEEGLGIPEHLKAERVRIPMDSSVDSLNVAVATGIALYSYRSVFPM